MFQFFSFQLFLFAVSRLTAIWATRHSCPFTVKNIGKQFIIMGWICGVIGFAVPASAQNQTSLVESARQRTNEIPQMQQQSLPLGVNVDQTALTTPGDLDLGIQLIMKRSEVEQPFRFFADASEFYTNNVGLTRSNTQSDSYFFGDVGFTYERRLTDELRFETTVRQGFFRYSQFNQLDFEDLNAGAGLSYEWKKLWDLTFFGRYNFERMTQGDVSRDFFRDHTITVGAQKTFLFAQNNYAYAGYSSMFGFASPTVAQRDEHGFYAGAHYNFTRKFGAELYYRIAAFDYTGTGRTDLNQTVIATLIYVFNDYARLTASASYTSDLSNHSVFNYDVVNTGGGLALQLRF